MGNRLSKIYTRTGDRGETGLAGGRRVPKSHPRIEAIGAVDELNSQLGLLLAELLEARGAHPGLEEIVQALAPVQHRLFDLGGELAMPEVAEPWPLLEWPPRLPPWLPPLPPP